jgi:hypothetical protein
MKKILLIIFSFSFLSISFLMDRRLTKTPIETTEEFFSRGMPSSVSALEYSWIQVNNEVSNSPEPENSNEREISGLREGQRLLDQLSIDLLHGKIKSHNPTKMWSKKDLRALARIDLS